MDYIIILQQFKWIKSEKGVEYHLKEDLRFFYTEGVRAPFLVELAGISYCDGSYYCEREHSDVTVVEYIIRGRGTVLCDGRQYTPGEGDVYILHQGSRHAYFADEKDPWIKIFCNLKGNLAEDLLRAYGLQDTVLVPGVWNEQIFRDLYALCFLKEPQQKIFQRCAIKFHEIVSALYTAGGADEVSGEAQLLRNYLDDHIFSRVRIEDLSALIYRSPDYVIKLFRKTYGQTPYAYLLRQKMRAAENLLRTTQLPCREIAHKLKFEDSHYFSNMFKKQHGISPKAYRDAVRPRREALDSLPGVMSSKPESSTERTCSSCVKPSP